MPIRRAEAADLPAIEAIVARAYEKYVERLGRRPSPMDDDYAAKVERGEALVWDEGGVAGVLVLIPAPTHILIENVAVEPDRQGEGIGGALLEFAEARARGLGLREIRLYTNAAMTENLRLYPRLGYVESGRRSQRGFDRVFFTKRLDPAEPA